MFFRKDKLKRDFDRKLVTLLQVTKEEWQSAARTEEMIDDFNFDVLIERKIKESRHFYLFKEARVREITLK